MRDFRLYMLVGGMPQAINEYLESNNLKKVDNIKRNILKLYERLSENRFDRTVIHTLRRHPCRASQEQLALPFVERSCK